MIREDMMKWRLLSLCSFYNLLIALGRWEAKWWWSWWGGLSLISFPKRHQDLAYVAMMINRVIWYYSCVTRTLPLSTTERQLVLLLHHHPFQWPLYSVGILRLNLVTTREVTKIYRYTDGECIFITANGTVRSIPSIHSDTQLEFSCLSPLLSSFKAIYVAFTDG